jgi:hypothetical protein
MMWEPLGRVERDAGNRLALPTAPALPAIYCFRICRGDEERRYVGETDNLARRLATPEPRSNSTNEQKQFWLDLPSIALGQRFSLYGRQSRLTRPVMASASAGRSAPA